MNDTQYRDSVQERDTSVGSAWRRLPIGRQLLIVVNAILIFVAGILLLLDYQVQFRRQLEQKRIALSEEAKAMYESLLAVAPHGHDAMQELIDNICARMNSTESPGHHIAVEWQGREFQAASHGRASPDMIIAMRTATGIGLESSQMAKTIMVGAFPGREGTVYVSEKRSMVVAEARQSLILHALAGMVVAAIAAIVVNVVLRRVISSPIEEMVTALHAVARGDLGVIAEGRTCKELTYLADQIDSMTRSLEESEKDRRFHMEKAREIQQHLLPNNLELNGLRVAQLFEPAEDVGGDYFDVLSLSDHKYLLCVADVTGHGVPAAMAAAVIKTLVQEAAEVSQSPREILERVNRRYTRIIMPGHLATMVAMVVDTRKSNVTYANAGHEPPFLQLPSGEVQRLMTADFLLGVDEDATYEEELVTLPKGAKLVLVSDGVTEAFDPNENQFGTERVVDAIQTSRGMSVDDVVGRFIDDLESFRRSRPPFDDTTLVVAEMVGEQQSLKSTESLRTA